MGYVTKAFTLWLGDIPACSSGTINIVPAATKVVQERTGLTASQISANSIAIVVCSMSFNDSNGVGWQYGPEVLQQSASLSAVTFTPDRYVRTAYKAAVGCG
jgi:hypothetical protein